MCRNNLGQENGLDHQENGFESQKNGLENGEENSGLAYLEFEGSNPFELFKEWHAEARASHLVNPDALCLSTSTREGRPSSRHVLLRRLEDNGMVVMTDGRSRKAAELGENPYASIAFLWSYRRGNQKVNRQVRLEGRVEELSQPACQEIWDREPLFCKIRANICDQGRPVDWQEHKRHHDRMLEDVRTGNVQPTQPSHVVYYKVIPTFMEFYYAYDNLIGDRLAFHASDNDARVWKKDRIAA